jgi:hypothetical protein
MDTSLTMRDFCVVLNTAGWRLFALLSDGSLHSVELNTDESVSLSVSPSFIGGNELLVFRSLGGRNNKRLGPNSLS